MLPLDSTEKVWITPIEIWQRAEGGVANFLENEKRTINAIARNRYEVQRPLILVRLLDVGI
ncbi:MAG TPA: hypothetical protein DCX94_13300 [Alteromonas macleodii]|nr:hypothetical protein AMBAS45_13855 [Alteromonas macleodii str. 'Balearic Sea AD45']HAX28892.1 hypothetical protein [Alteromonas macleodii]